MGNVELSGMLPALMLVVTKIYQINGMEVAKYSGSMIMDYTNTLANGMEFFASVDVQFQDTFIGTGDLDPIDTQEKLELFNARVGLRSDSWELMLYGNNLGDEVLRFWTL